MEVLDLRPWYMRRLDASWRRPGLVRGPVTPGEASSGSGLQAWNHLVDRFQALRLASRNVTPAPPFVVSVGNLALGGTGKTPLVSDLAMNLSRLGHVGCVLTRGYGSSLPGPVVVEPDNSRAGDEARMLARALTETPWQVVQARDRAAGLAACRDRRPVPDVVIIEDGHQTGGVGRHLDIVILDRWVVETAGGSPRVVPATGPVFPFGPWRESARGAMRAGLWVVEGGGGDLRMGPEGRPVPSFRRGLRLVEAVSGEPGKIGEGMAWAALSGIARPEPFEAGVAELSGYPPALAIRCRDHAPYDEALVRRIADRCRMRGVTEVVTTAKDWVKLAGIWDHSLNMFVAEMEIVWEGETTLPALVGERLLPSGSGRIR